MSSQNFCQIPNCTNLQFTHCAHCSLNICFRCLHPHYQLMKHEYQQDLGNIDMQLNRNYQQVIEQEKDISLRLFQIRSSQYDQMKKFLDEKSDFHISTNMTKFQVTDCLEMKERYALMMDMHQRFCRLLDEITRLVGDFQPNRSGRYNHNSSVGGRNEYSLSNGHAGAFAIDALPVVQSETTPMVELHEEGCPLRTSSISNPEISTNVTVHSLINPSAKTDYSVHDLKEMFFTCPFTTYTFGLQRHRHQSLRVANIPCRNLKKRDFCLYQHLLQHHAFNANTALEIIRVLIRSPDRLDQIDLFSHQSIESLISNQVLSYIGDCPLHKTDVYGILPTHDIRLCVEHQSKNIPVHHHLRSYHKISYRFATRLVEAILKKIHEKIPIIRPNDTLHGKA